MRKDLEKRYIKSMCEDYSKEQLVKMLCKEMVEFVSLEHL